MYMCVCIYIYIYVYVYIYIYIYIYIYTTNGYSRKFVVTLFGRGMGMNITAHNWRSMDLASKHDALQHGPDRWRTAGGEP